VDNEQSQRRNTSRGRGAETPVEIPSTGWKDIFARVTKRVVQHNLTIIAAGVAFYGFLAIFPGLAAFISIYGLLTNPSELQNHLQVLENLLPPQSVALIQSQLEHLVDGQQRLGWGLTGSLILALWSASRGMKALMKAMNITYGEEESRGMIRLNLTALALTLGAILLGILFLTTIAVVPALLSILSLAGITAALVNYLRWPLLLVGGFFAVAILYRYAPCRNRAQWKWVSPGAAIAVGVWLLGSLLFSFYISNFNNYGAMYGSLGVVIILMIWFFLIAYSILLGSEVNAEIERQTTRDTTSGAPHPRGSRGASIANTVGRR
jgi:membrane protein